MKAKAFDINRWKAEAAKAGLKIWITPAGTLEIYSETGQTMVHPPVGKKDEEKNPGRMQDAVETAIKRKLARKSMPTTKIKALPEELPAQEETETPDYSNESFGSQSCADVADVVSATKKHSLPAAVPAWLRGVG